MISSTGPAGDYTLTGTVTGDGGISVWPTGIVSFVDMTNRYIVGAATLWTPTVAQIFGADVSYTAGDSPVSVAAGDFNGDGKLDLAVANYGSNNVSVLLGNGDGTFQPQIAYPTEILNQAVVTGDFNGDGKLDLAVANTDVSVLLGNGDGFALRHHGMYPDGA